MSDSPSTPPESPETRAERDARIAELETKLSKPRSVGVMPPVAALALVGALGLLWQERSDLEYYFSSREPIELGSEGDYHFDAARPNRYVQLHGVPTVRGAYWEEQGRAWVAIGVRDTPVLVKRVTLPSEDWKAGLRPPRPDQRPFQVRGRLLSRGDAMKYEGAFVEHQAWGEVSPKWLLVAEARPGGDFGAMGWVAALVAFAAVNAWLLVRGLIALLRGRK